jgi:hypothetical protein
MRWPRICYAKKMSAPSRVTTHEQGSPRESGLLLRCKLRGCNCVDAWNDASLRTRRSSTRMVGGSDIHTTLVSWSQSATVHAILIATPVQKTDEREMIRARRVYCCDIASPCSGMCRLAEMSHR